MKISILLPFRKFFTGLCCAVSLFINDTIKLSKFKNTSTVYGFTEYKKFKNSYINIDTPKKYSPAQIKIM